MIIGRETPQRVTKSGPKDWQPSTCQKSLRKISGSHLLGTWRWSWKMEYWWLLMIPWNEKTLQNTSSKSIFISWLTLSKWWTYPKWQSSSGLPFRKPQPGDCLRHRLHNWRNCETMKDGLMVQVGVEDWSIQTPNSVNVAPFCFIHPGLFG